MLLDGVILAVLAVSVIYGLVRGLVHSAFVLLALAGAAYLAALALALPWSAPWAERLPGLLLYLLLFIILRLLFLWPAAQLRRRLPSGWNHSLTAAATGLGVGVLVLTLAWFAALRLAPEQTAALGEESGSRLLSPLLRLAADPAYRFAAAYFPAHPSAQGAASGSLQIELQDGVIINLAPRPRSQTAGGSTSGQRGRSFQEILEQSYQSAEGDNPLERATDQLIKLQDSSAFAPASGGVSLESLLQKRGEGAQGGTASAEYQDALSTLQQSLEGLEEKDRKRIESLIGKSGLAGSSGDEEDLKEARRKMEELFGSDDPLAKRLRNLPDASGETPGTSFNDLIESDDPLGQRLRNAPPQ